MRALFIIMAILSTFAAPIYAKSTPADSDLLCMAHTLYGEARSEGAMGMQAVAEVVNNRVASPRYPNTICEVVRQPWQFSYLNGVDGWPEIKEQIYWRMARFIAAFYVHKNHTLFAEGATHYHARYVNPSWADPDLRVAVINSTHIFYAGVK